MDEFLDGVRRDRDNRPAQWRHLDLRRVDELPAEGTYVWFRGARYAEGYREPASFEGVGVVRLGGIAFLSADGREFSLSLSDPEDFIYSVEPVKVPSWEIGRPSSRICHSPNDLVKGLADELVGCRLESIWQDGDPSSPATITATNGKSIVLSGATFQADESEVSAHTELSAHQITLQSPVANVILAEDARDGFGRTEFARIDFTDRRGECLGGIEFKVTFDSDPDTEVNPAATGFAVEVQSASGGASDCRD